MAKTRPIAKRVSFAARRPAPPVMIESSGSSDSEQDEGNEVSENTKSLDETVTNGGPKNMVQKCSLGAVKLESSPLQTAFAGRNDLLPPHLRANITVHGNSTSSGSAPIESNERLLPEVSLQQATPEYCDQFIACGYGDLTLSPPVETPIVQLPSPSTMKNVFDSNMFAQLADASRHLGAISNHVAQEFLENENSGGTYDVKHAVLLEFREKVHRACTDGELMQVCLLLKDCYEAKLGEQAADIWRLNVHCEDLQQTAKTFETQVNALNVQVAQLETENQTLRMYEELHMASEAKSRSDANMTLFPSNDQLGLDLGFELIPPTPSSHALNAVSEQNENNNDESSVSGAVRGRMSNLRRTTLAIIPGLEEKFNARRKTLGLDVSVVRQLCTHKLDDLVARSSNDTSKPSIPEVAIEMKPMQSPVPLISLSPAPNSSFYFLDAEGHDHFETSIDACGTSHQNADENVETNGVVVSSGDFFHRDSGAGKATAARSKFGKSPVRTIIQKKSKPRHGLADLALSTLSSFGIACNDDNTTDVTNNSRRDSGRLRTSNVNSSSVSRWPGAGPPTTHAPSSSPLSATNSSLSSFQLSGSGISVGAASGSLSIIDERAEFDSSQAGAADITRRGSAAGKTENGAHDMPASFKNARNHLPIIENDADGDVDHDIESVIEEQNHAGTLSDDKQHKQLHSSAGSVGEKQLNPFDDLCAGLDGLRILSGNRSAVAAAASSPSLFQSSPDDSPDAFSSKIANEKIIYVPCVARAAEAARMRTLPQKLFGRPVERDAHPLSPTVPESKPISITDLNPLDGAGNAVALVNGNEAKDDGRCSNKFDAVDNKESSDYLNKIIFLENWFTQVVRILKAEQQFPPVAEEQQKQPERGGAIDKFYKIRWARLRKLIETFSMYPDTIDALREELKRQKRQILKLEDARYHQTKRDAVLQNNNC